MVFQMGMGPEPFKDDPLKRRKCFLNDLLAAMKRNAKSQPMPGLGQWLIELGRMFEIIGIKTEQNRRRRNIQLRECHELPAGGGRPFGK